MPSTPALHKWGHKEGTAWLPITQSTGLRIYWASFLFASVWVHQRASKNFLVFPPDSRVWDARHRLAKSGAPDNQASLPTPRSSSSKRHQHSLRDVLIFP